MTPMGYHLLIAVQRSRRQRRRHPSRRCKNREDIASIVGKVVSVGQDVRNGHVSLQGHGHGMKVGEWSANHCWHRFDMTAAKVHDPHGR